MGGARICRQGGRTAYLWGEPDFTIHLAQKKKDQNKKETHSKGMN
jgi:hypothetical protein